MKPMKPKTSSSFARRLCESLALMWRRIHGTWQSENYPAWMMSLPNPPPPTWEPIWPRQRANKGMSGRGRVAIHRTGTARPSAPSAREHFAADLDLGKLQ
jgi:hypothetical protein